MTATTLARAGFDLVTATDLRCCEAVGYDGLAPGLAAALGLPTDGVRDGDEVGLAATAGPVSVTGDELGLAAVAGLMSVTGESLGLAATAGPVSVTGDGWAAVPADVLPYIAWWIADGRPLAAENALVTRHPHRLADAEGVALVRVANTRRESDAADTHTAPEAPFQCDQPRTDLHVALRFAAVRLGVTRRMLDLAARHLGERMSGDVPLLRLQLPQATIADCAAGIELARESLAIMATTAPLVGRPPEPDPSLLADLHARISELAWQVTTLFGASGYVADHPVRCLYVSELLRNLLVPGPTAALCDDDRADRGH